MPKNETQSKKRSAVTQTRPNIRPFKCTQENCNKAYPTKGGLTIHQMTHDPNRPTYPCDLCDKTFFDKKAFVDHKNVHAGIRPYACDFCSATFVRSAAWLAHRRTHTKEKPYKCSDCQASFAQHSTLVQHKRTHTGEKPYTCSSCDQTFSRAHHLTTHELTHTGEFPFMCTFPECDRRFRRDSDRVSHFRTHTGEKPYQCDFEDCDARFTLSGHLIVHRRTHTGEKPYVCEVCSKGFASSGGLRSHSVTHTGEKPCVCKFPDCTAAYTQSNNLRLHERLCHLGKCIRCIAAGQSERSAPSIHYKFIDDQLCLDCAMFVYADERAFRAEYRIAHELQKALVGHPEVVRVELNRVNPEDIQHCSKFRPDIRIITRTLGNIIVEIDEHGHVSYVCTSKEIEAKWTDLQIQARLVKATDDDIQFPAILTPSQRRKIREDSRVSHLVTSGYIDPTHVWRFNPDRYVDSNGHIFTETHIEDAHGRPVKANLAQAQKFRSDYLIQDILAFLDGRLTFEGNHFVNVVYLFYNGAKRREDFIPIDPEEYHKWIANLSELG